MLPRTDQRRIRRSQTCAGLLVLASLLLTVAPITARATYLTQTQRFDIVTPYPNGVPPSPGVIAAVGYAESSSTNGHKSDTEVQSDTPSFTLFDPALGTLNSVAVQVVSDVAVQFGARSICNPFGGCDVGLGAHGSITSSHVVRDELVLSTAVPQVVFSQPYYQSFSCSWTKVSYFGTDRCQRTRNIVDGIGGRVTYTGSDIDSFLGHGAFDAVFDTSASVTADATCVILNVSQTCRADAVSVAYWSGSMTLIYDYTAAGTGPGQQSGGTVPEPPTALLVGTGLVGLFGVRRRKRIAGESDSGCHERARGERTSADVEGQGGS